MLTHSSQISRLLPSPFGRSRTATGLLALISCMLFLSCALAGTAHAADNDYCPTGSTTTYDGPTNGTWGTGSPSTTTNWSQGLPDDNCQAVIPAGDTVTLTTTPGQGSEGTYAGGSAQGLTLDGGATLIVEGVSSQGEQGNPSNSTGLQIGSYGLTIDQGATLDLEATDDISPFTGDSSGEASGGSVQLYGDGSATASIDNAGTVNASSSDSSYGESIAWTGNLTNTGTLNVISGTLTAQGQDYPMLFNNTGSVNVSSGATYSSDAGDGSSFNNDGTFANQGTATFYTSGSMYWAQTGGSETGNPIDLTGGMGLEDSAGSGSFAYTNCAGGFLSGTVPANQTISVVGGCSGTSLYLGTRNSTNTVVNDGTLILDAPSGANGSDAIIQGGELENNGILESTVGGGLPLANQLLDTLDNESGGKVTLSGGELAQTAGTATTNNGSVTVGPGATWLVQAGSFTNAGSVAVGISSPADLGQFNLTTGAKFDAGGALAPTLDSGYAPAAGTEFEVLLYNGGSVSGTFAAVSDGFTADYSKETASPGYVGVVYGGSASTGAAKPSAKALKGGAAEIKATLSCAQSAKSCLKYSITATITEHLKGGKLTAVSARASNKKTKKKATTKVVKVATYTGSVSAGKSKTITIKLNGAGDALLKRFGKLKVSVTISAGGEKLASATVTVTRAPKGKAKK